MVTMYLGKADVNAYDKGVEREFLVSNGMGPRSWVQIPEESTVFWSFVRTIRNSTRC